MSTAQDTIGKLIDERQQRDAVHIALAPAIAGEDLRPGMHVGLRNGSSVDDNHIGIVDPFISGPVMKGQRFWLFLYPNTVTGMRHEWQHPAFPQEGRPFVPAGASAEETRLREIAQAIGIDYHDLMYGADEWVRTSKGSKWGGEYIVQQGSEGWRNDFPAYVDEFWRLYDAVRGVTVPTEHRESFFSCSC